MFKKHAVILDYYCFDEFGIDLMTICRVVDISIFVVKYLLIL